jgi:hypothetical protein
MFMLPVNYQFGESSKVIIFLVMLQCRQITSCIFPCSVERQRLSGDENTASVAQRHLQRKLSN